MRVNTSLPDDLAERVRQELPDLNVSSVLQDALRRLLACDHEHLVCADCASRIATVELTAEALDQFYRDLLWEWQPLVDRRGTAEGAARIAQRLAVDAGVPSAPFLALPRPPRKRAS